MASRGKKEREAAPDDLTATEVESLEPMVSDERLARMDAVLDRRTRTVTVVLEEIYDPHNIAAVVRTCEAFGFQDLHIITGDRSGRRFLPSKGVSIGTTRWLTLHAWSEPVSCVRDLQRRGYRVLATTVDAAVPIQTIDFCAPTAVVFGNEREGVSEEMLAMCDGRIAIDMNGFVESFNISVAAGIVLHQAFQHRQAHLGEGAGDLSASDRAAIRARWVYEDVPRASAVLDRIRNAK